MGNIMTLIRIMAALDMVQGLNNQATKKKGYNYYRNIIQLFDRILFIVLFVVV